MLSFSELKKLNPQHVEFFRTQKLNSQNVEFFRNQKLNSQHVDFFSHRKAGEVKIQICNPTVKKNGFESSYSFIDIVNDDMPFLVDSTVSYLDKYGIKIKNIIHPIYFVTRSKSGKLEEISVNKKLL